MIDKIITCALNERLLAKTLKKMRKVIKNGFTRRIKKAKKLQKKLTKALDVVFSYIPIKIARGILPINPKKIVFMTNSCNYTCNPKYICEALLKDKNDYEIVWVVDDIKKKKFTYPNSVKLTKLGTLTCFYHVYTAKVWIDNGIAFSDYFDKKKGQYKIQTMHGSLGIKRLDNAVLARNAKGFTGKRVVKRETKNTDLVITNSLFEEEVFRSIFWKNTPMERLGHARTDILFEKNEKTIYYIRQRLFEKYGVPYDKKILLYGPTHRMGLKPKDLYINFEEVIEALNQRFGDEYVVLLRLHDRNVDMAKKVLKGQKVYNVSKYPDIQELMLVTDLAITDYSSWIYDYVVTGKRGLIHATDLERYNNITGLYYPLEETPFPVSYNATQLIENILTFDDAVYSKRVNEFLANKEAVDDGQSTDRIVRRIKSIMNG